MSRVETYFNQFLPLGGNAGMQQTATIGLNTVGTSIDLRTVFGPNIDNGDQILIKADGLFQPSGWRGYFSLSEKPTPINETAQAGSASGAQGWPLLDGQEITGHLTSGRIVATGFATQLDFKHLNVKSNVGSGTFKLMRRTLTELSDASKFQAPGSPTMFAPTGVAFIPTGGWNPRP
jgi:hypothetical protein